MISIGISTRGNDINIGLLKFIKQSPYPLIVGECYYSPTIAQEDVLQQASLTDNDLFLLDSDITPTNEVLEWLVRADKDVVCAPVYHYSNSAKVIHLDVRTEGVVNYVMKYTGMEPIIGASFACLLIKNRVLKLFKSLNEPFCYDKNIVTGLQPADNCFYGKLRHLKVPMYVCWDAQGCTHSKLVDLNVQVLTKFKMLTC